MGLCRRCIANGLKREGGQFSVCRYHARTKCRVCGVASLGEELCAPHAHTAEIMRWKARSKFQLQDRRDYATDIEMRTHRLTEAKFMAHQAVEVVFHALLGAVVAIWAKPQDWEKFKEEDVAA